MHPFTRVYWFLISKGYKTYLLISRNFPEYWPRHDRETPPWQAEVLHTLATEKFGDAYKPELGIVRFDESHGRLKEGVAPIDDALLEHKDIRFFVEQNPGHEEGEELCCIGRIGAGQWTYFTGRLVKKTLSRWARALQRAFGGQ